MNIYISNIFFKYTEGPNANKGKRTNGFGGWLGICYRKDFSPGAIYRDTRNFAVVSAMYGDNKPAPSPEYDPIFPSIAAHAFVSTK